MGTRLIHVVDASVLDSNTRSTPLKVRCAGDDFVPSLYRCTLP